jgi:hypothetical protein
LASPPSNRLLVRTVVVPPRTPGKAIRKRESKLGTTLTSRNGRASTSVTGAPAKKSAWRVPRKK